MLSRVERPLTDAERDEIRTHHARAVSESRSALFKTGMIGAALCAVLAALTMLASDAPNTVISIFWAVITAGLTAWIGLPWRKLMLGQVRSWEDALRTNRAVATRVQASRVVEFEEEEDEGACYAFAFDTATCVFVVGQEFYEDDDFPNTDFSLIDVLGTTGVAVTTLVTKRGRKLQPERIVSASLKNTLEIPEHLAVLPVAIDRVETALPRLQG